MLLTSIVLHGRVQNIGFRAFVKNIAEEMKLTGEVWNNYDRTLEIKVYTEDKKTLDEFLEKIKVGPKYKSISKIDIVITTSEPYIKDEFIIRQ